MHGTYNVKPTKAYHIYVTARVYNVNLVVYHISKEHSLIHGH
jgi:hypothetical protein